MSSDPHLWRRGDQWYLKLYIPRPLRQHFLSSTGKPKDKIVEPLGDSKEVARLKAAHRVAAYEGVFARLRAGEALAEIKASVEMELSSRGSHVVVTSQAYRDAIGEELQHILKAFHDRVADVVKKHGVSLGSQQTAQVPIMMTAPAPTTQTETINQAAEAWFADMQRDSSAAVRPQTLDAHKLYVRAFVQACGDIPLASVTRQMAADFLHKIGTARSNRTLNKYATTLASVFKNARHRGRFVGENPFEGQKKKVGGEKIPPFTMEELTSLFGSFQFDIAPKRHSPESSIPWVALIGLYSGLRLEEIAQLDVADIHPQDGLMVFEIHNGTRNHLKNGTSERLVPVHSELIRLGLLRYRDNLPKDGLLFPGLSRRASKGGKIGARLGELFGKRLEALGIKAKAEAEKRRVCFHSLRKNAGGAMERGGASESDSGRVLGHALGMTFGTYSQPVLERVQETVERISYPDLKIPAASSSK